MFEFHGWATIQEFTLEVDIGQLELKVRNIQTFIK
nr:Imm7 family immunity protein [Paenibacillus piscarius]